jgi:hypothetical protein
VEGELEMNEASSPFLFFCELLSEWWLTGFEGGLGFVLFN